MTCPDSKQLRAVCSFSAPQSCIHLNVSRSSKKLGMESRDSSGYKRRRGRKKSGEEVKESGERGQPWTSLSFRSPAS